MKQWRFKTAYFPLILLLVSVLSYGLLIPWLGFYWDDWPYAYLNHLLGPAGFPAFVASDRPFSAWIFMATAWLFGKNPLGYHLLALVLRWLTAVLVWWSLRQVWPRRSREIGWIALLFAVYPGFKQQPIALIYNHHFSVMALFLLSLGGMFLSVRKPKWYWPLTLLSMAGAASMFSIEYFFGLEFLRPIFLWLIAGETTTTIKTRLKQTLLHWLPYLAVMVVFLIWRVLIFKFPTYQPDLITASPQALPGAFLPKVIQELFSAGLLAWITTIFPQGLSVAGLKASLVYAVLVGASIILVIIFLARSETQSTEDHDGKGQRQWGIQCTMIGLFALVFAGIPTWVTNLPVRLVFPWDRLTLAFMLGSSMFLIGLLSLLPVRNLVKIAAVSLAVALAIGAHFQNENTYRMDWEMQKSFFWQLTWRVPSIQPDTVIYSDQFPLTYYSDNSLTAPLNWIYAPDNHSTDLSYMFYFLSVRLGGDNLPSLSPNQPIRQTYRSLNFSGDTSKALTIYYNPPGCVRVLDVVLDDSFPVLTPLESQSVPLSDLARVETQPNQPAAPPTAIFGSQPRPSWCYYFEKADLARQMSDWGQIVELGSSAFTLNDNPNEASELLPFIEGYAHTGDWLRANELTQQAFERSYYVKSMLCATWNRIEKSMPADQVNQGMLQQVRDELQCSDH